MGATSVSVQIVAPGAHASPPAWCTASGSLNVQDLPTSIDPTTCLILGRTIEGHGVSVVVPMPGEGITAEASRLDGVDESLAVLTQTDGTVLINPEPQAGVTGDGGDLSSTYDMDPTITDAELFHPPLQSDDNANGAVADTPDPSLVEVQAGASSPSKCTDGTYNRPTGHPHYYTAPSYYYNTSGQRTQYSTATWVSAVNAAQVNMSRGDNSCGFSSDPKIYATYRGGTTRALNVGQSATKPTCTAADGYSVMGWGTLPANYYAVTCASNDATYHMKSGDIMINKALSYTIGSLSGCTGSRIDLEAGLTHEFGHFFGIAHVDETTHGNLVMSTQINGFCEAAERNLGKGDLLGMLSLYGHT